jgi:hypothetical protein
VNERAHPRGEPEVLRQDLAIDGLHDEHVDGLHGRGARSRREHRELAEDVAGPHLAEHDALTADGLVRDASTARDDVRHVADLTLAHDDLTGLERRRRGSRFAATKALQLLPEIERARESVLRLARGRRQRDAGERGRDRAAGHELLRRRDLSFERHLTQRARVLGEVRRTSRQDLVQDRAEREDVRARTDGAPRRPRLLRRHVRDRPAAVVALVHEPRHVDAAALRVSGDSREPPVHQVDATERVDHHVLRLDVAMHDALAVREGDRIADLHQDLEQIAERLGIARHRGGRDLLRERPSAQDLHRKIRLVLHDEIVDGHDVRVIELRGDLRLEREPTELVVVHVLRAEALQRDVAAKDSIERAMHRRHASATQLFAHFVAIDRRRRRGRRERLRRVAER